MPRVFVAVLVSVVTLGLAPVLSQSAAATPPTHSISVSGTGVTMFPAFTPSVHRYGITTTDSTAGTVVVTATTSDASGSVWVDGQRAPGGTATLNGLVSGNEISVFIKDSTATSVYSLIYLPVGFPTLTVTKHAGVAAGDVFLTLTNFSGLTPSYETAIDNNGVPVYAKADTGVPLDFKRQPNGDYSVFRTPTPTAGRTGGQEVELNSRFQQIAAFETDGGLTNTDGHDSILLANGDRWLIATQPRAVTGDLDATIQEQSPTGAVLFQWSTADHVNRTLDTMVPSNNPDYAHINSIAVMNNGDILASFRHLSQVMEIATSAHNGFKKGDVVWRLGGRRSTFTFPNDPDGGPCAQHAASELPNGDILLFDDGSESISGSPLLCVDPADRANGASIARPQTRVAEFSVNPSTGRANLAWTYQVTGQTTSFAGSAQRLSNGDTMVGWAASNRTSVATEVNHAKHVVWNLRDNGGLFTYRALRFSAPDATPPVATVTAPAQGATYAFNQKVNSNFSCTDAGGSNLQSCAGPVTEGAAIDTTRPGTHTFTVVAKDGAGNAKTVTRTYHVGPAATAYRPDALIKQPSSGTYLGGAVFGTSTKQHITQTIAAAGHSATAWVRVQNDGSHTDRLTLKGTAGTSKFAVSYFAGSRNVTRQVTAGTYKTPSLASGDWFTLRVKITRTTKAKPGMSRTVRLTAASAHKPSTHDTVATIVRATH